MPPRKKHAVFAAPSEADSSHSRVQLNDPLSSALSERVAPGKARFFPTLVSLCCHKFAQSLLYQFGDAQVTTTISPSAVKQRRRTRQQLNGLPEHLSQRIFNVLRSTHPTLMSHPFILEYFLKWSIIRLNGTMTGVTRMTVLAVQRVKSKLTELDLSGLTRIKDEDFARAIDGCQNLEILILRGSTKVAGKAITTASTCPRLRIVNLNYTSTPPILSFDLLRGCPNLEVLKLASLPNFTDNTLHKIVSLIVDHRDVTPESGSPRSTPNASVEFPNLISLKLRMNALSETYLPQFLSFFPSLTRLDLSFTSLRRLVLPTPPPPLEKLHLTSTQVSFTDVQQAVSILPKLKKLGLGALGLGRLGSTLPMNSSALVLNDMNLLSLTGALATYCTQLEDINLVGNTKLGSGFGAAGAQGALRDFITEVGRKCKRLNLSSTSLRSSDLIGFDPSLDDPPPTAPASPSLQALLLNNTKIDDEAGLYISHCKSLEVLEVGGTRISKEGLFNIINSCDLLESLDLTSCRGVKVTERRIFFEIWEKEHG